ncbi:hypothetical protein NMY22_g18052 [Coprinellus aureogranulatus]|nr:hypothetical protein NMY22_g18052 [Coprinellus aureogranulatus]
MQPNRYPIPPSGGGFNAFPGAHHFSVNDLRIVNHSHTYVGSGQHFDLARALNPLHDASHKRNRKVAPPDSSCLPGTREKVFSEVRSWINGSQTNDNSPSHSSLVGGGGAVKCVCWMHGYVGCGKSAIAQSIAEEYARIHRLAASFFFFRNAGGRSTIDQFAATLAHQISINVPGAKALIELAIFEDPGLLQPTCSLENQLEHLVYRPLAVALPKSGIRADAPFLIIIDGLDESSLEDIVSFLEAAFTQARKHHRPLREMGAEWPGSQAIHALADYCDGSFIFASTIARFILDGAGPADPRTPMERLPFALKVNPGLA